MRLELGTFPVREVAFGVGTRYEHGALTVDKAAMLAEVREDPRLATADLEIARPGESVRIWPVRDVVEPRVKVEGPGVVYPGICGRDIATVGQGRTHRLAGLGVVEVSSVLQHGGALVFNETYVDMARPGDAHFLYAGLINLCLVVEPDPTLGIDARNDAVHKATLTVSDIVAATVRELEPPELEVFELAPSDPALPGVIYIQCINSPQSKSGGSVLAFGTATYGQTRLSAPWFLHPNEILDGALNGPYRTPFDMSWATINNPLHLDLYRRHGKDWNFLGVIVQRTEWTTMHEKQLVANQAAKLAQHLGAQGAMVTWDAGGNDFIEVIRTVQACERLGIKTVFLTSEDDSAEGASTMLEPLPEADAIVSTGFFDNAKLGSPDAAPVEKVIGIEEKPLQRDLRVRDRTELILGPTAGSMPPPWRYDDHYGFFSISGIE